MTINRTPRPLLANVLTMIGPGEPTIEQRLCDAMFDIAIAGRGGSPKLLWEKASLRVADGLEHAVRQRCRKSQQAWRWKLSQRRSLAAEIVRSAFGGPDFENIVMIYAGKLIRTKLWQVNERHVEYIEAISHNIPTNGVIEWLFYWAKEANDCNLKDRDIVKILLYACHDVGFSLKTWLEMCS